jgi:hypothetical protein
MIHHGTGPTRRDKRDFSFHRTFGAAALPELPPEYSCDAGLTMPDQNADGFPFGCTGYTQADLCTDEDGIVFDAAFTYRKTCELEGHDTTSGCQIRNSLKTTIAYGLIPKNDPNQDPLRYRRGKYFNVDKVPGLDWFDSIRSTLWLNRQERRAISTGTPWYPSFNRSRKGAASLDNSDPASLPWHNWAIKGWKIINGSPYLIAKAWQGADYGDHGWLYFDRPTVNRLMDVWGVAAFTVRKFAPEDVKTIKQTVTEACLSLIGRLAALGYLREALADLLAFLKITAAPKQVATPPIEPVAPPPAPTPAPLPPEPAPAPTALLWDTVEHAKHSVRVICDEEGLTVPQKNDLCATVGAESGWQSYYLAGVLKGKPVKRDNVDPKTGEVWSRDWGIAQINDAPKNAHIGPGKDFPSVPYVLNNPEACIRWMARMWKAGHANWWIAYKSGAYRKFL